MKGLCISLTAIGRVQLTPSFSGFLVGNNTIVGNITIVGNNYGKFVYYENSLI